MKSISVRTGLVNDLTVSPTKKNQKAMCELAVFMIYVRDYMKDPEGQEKFRNFICNWAEENRKSIHEVLVALDYFKEGDR